MILLVLRDYKVQSWYDTHPKFNENISVALVDVHVHKPLSFLIMEDRLKTAANEVNL
jgi:hypothetical protein